MFPRLRPDQSRASGSAPSRHRVALGAGLLACSVVVAVAVLVAARGDSSEQASAVTVDGAPASDLEAPEASPEEDHSAGTDIASRIRPLESALDLPPVTSGPQPVAISFASIGVEGSSIDGVGVEANGELTVPGPLRVGWYEFGPRPGDDGSSVLAAHIASGGVDGVFRHLADAAVGDEFELTFDDGSIDRYRLIELVQYDKDDLPIDRVFAREGPSVVTLITCGGAFQPSVGSYEDNVVAYAVPVDPS